MDYEIVTLDEKFVAGVQIVTNNSAADMQSKIGGLWQKLYSGIAQSMKNRTNRKAIGLYCDYQQNGDYTVLAGCEIKSEGIIDAEKSALSVKKISGGKYAKFVVKGDVQKAVGNAWGEIWKTPLERTFTGDFEEYQEDTESGSGTIIIYIAVR